MLKLQQPFAHPGPLRASAHTQSEHARQGVHVLWETLSQCEKIPTLLKMRNGSMFVTATKPTLQDNPAPARMKVKVGHSQ
jgi:hypothetical protein